MDIFKSPLSIILVLGLVFFFIRWQRAKSRDAQQTSRAEKVRPPEPKPVSQSVDQENKLSPDTCPPYDPTDDVQNEDPGAVRLGAAYVVDGDTIVIQKTQIRLFGVDAPEMNHPHGKNAKWALVKLCKGQKVRAELLSHDAHGRTVARCYLPDGRDLSAEMVKMGLAIDWPKYSEGAYAALETPEARKKMWLADARQKGHMHVWDRFEKRQAARKLKGS